jgi:hypothetical protein
MSRFEDQIAAAVEKLIASEFAALGKITPKSALRFQKLVGDLQRELRIIGQAQVTIVVDRAH